MRKLFLASMVMLGFFMLPRATAAAIIDFSDTTGFGLNEERVMVKNIRINQEIVNPFDPSRPTIYSIYYDVPFRFDLATLHLIPDLSGAVVNNPERNCANLVVAVTDAFTGQPLPNASVTVGNVTQLSGATDGKATFSNLPAGVTSMTVSASDYQNATRNPELTCATPNSLGVALNPTSGAGALTANQVRIILNWGENPEDLDAHLTGPEPGLAASSYNDAERFHIAWYELSAADGVAVLDVDDTTSFGPETVTISPPPGQSVLRPGVYRYSVHHYYGSSSIAAGTTVELIAGTERRTFTAPAGGAGVEDDVWTVLELVVDNTGHITIRPVNSYQQGVSTGGVRSGSRGVLPDTEDPRLYQGRK